MCLSYDFRILIEGPSYRLAKPRGKTLARIGVLPRAVVCPEKTIFRFEQAHKCWHIPVK